MNKKIFDRGFHKGSCGYFHTAFYFFKQAVTVQSVMFKSYYSDDKDFLGTIESKLQTSMNGGILTVTDCDALRLAAKGMKKDSK